MSTHHDPIQLVAGDDWSIEGALVDLDGAPLDLTGATLTWQLLDPAGARLSVAGQITPAEPLTGGIVSIVVAAAATAALDPGVYTDALRIDLGGKRSQMWAGQIRVQCNLFA